MSQNLLDPDATLCYLPYSTIEVVFNHEQLWGNLQNHHPAVIYYDLEDTYLWRPFLTAKPNPIDSFIFIAPSTRDKAWYAYSLYIYDLKKKLCSKPGVADAIFFC